MSPEDIIDECYKGECDMGQIVDWDTYEDSINQEIYTDRFVSEAEELEILMNWDPEDEDLAFGNDDEEDY